jgi:REP element-mobilizing transposase RayT
MSFDPGKHHRRSIRLPGHDYGQVGAYFITVCTRNRQCLFGDVVDEAMRLNECGETVEHEWSRTGVLRRNLVPDAFIVMPNHFHAIVTLPDSGRGVLQYAPTADQPSLRSPSQTIGAIVRGFKSAVTRQINALRRTARVSVWQRNYYEHIIRSEASLNAIRCYIESNPLLWRYDAYNPAPKARPRKEIGRLLVERFGFTGQELEFIMNRGIEAALDRPHRIETPCPLLLSNSTKR